MKKFKLFIDFNGIIIDWICKVSFDVHTRFYRVHARLS